MKTGFITNDSANSVALAGDFISTTVGSWVEKSPQRQDCGLYLIQRFPEGNRYYAAVVWFISSLKLTTFSTTFALDSSISTACSSKATLRILFIISLFFL